MIVHEKTSVLGLCAALNFAFSMTVHSAILRERNVSYGRRTLGHSTVVFKLLYATDTQIMSQLNCGPAQLQSQTTKYHN